MLILILVNVQYLHNVAFGFEKGLSDQNHSLADYHYSTEKFPQANISPPPPYYLVLFGKPWRKDQVR